MTVNKDGGYIFYGNNGIGVSFADHNEHMREFRNSHPGELEMRVSRRALINTMRPLLLANMVKETGGTMRPVSAVDWTSIVPMPTVAKHRFSPN